MEIKKIVDVCDWGKKVPKFRDAARAWKFLKKEGFRRLPVDIELVFLKDINLCVDYAIRIDSRLPKVFEDKIMSDIDVGFRYLRDVIGGPIKEYEDNFKNHPKILVKYAKEVLKSRLPEHLELCLVGDPYSCFEYSWGVLDGVLPEILHNYMFGAVMDSKFIKKYRSSIWQSKISDAEEYNPDYASPQEYFEFIKWQRKNLYRLVIHYANMHNVDTTRSVNEFLYELENGR